MMADKFFGGDIDLCAVCHEHLVMDTPLLETLDKRNASLEPDIDSVFNRLGVINDVRNQLVHYGVTRPWGETDNLPYVSNERTAARADKVQEVIVAVSDLELMD